MGQPFKVPVWLLIFIAILPQFSETVYTPALPDIAHYLNVSESMAEYTLSIYLLGLAIGTLFWGRLSDRIGRRPCLLMGTLIFVFGCLGCFLSCSIELLMISRFIQALGGSTGSVLGQSIGRDAFKGSERGKVFSLVGSAISFAPAVGPVLGGIMDEVFGWSSIFLLLTGYGLFVFFLNYKYLPETYSPPSGESGQFIALFRSMVLDKTLMMRALFVGMLLGIMFSYYSEGSFYLIELLNLSPKVYGASFVLLALSGTTGALWARRLHNTLKNDQIIERGLILFWGGTIVFLMGIGICSLLNMGYCYFIGVTLVSMMVLCFSCSMIIPSTMSIALEKYEYATGTASSFFGFLYYAIVSVATFLMGVIHDGTLIVMPIYFLVLSSLCLFIHFRYLRKGT
ncbi:MAG: multidrug effflux MFS transporter [Alphaproteobacteria bacterium]